MKETPTQLPAASAQCTRLLVTGDIDGNAMWLEGLIDIARDFGCEALVQLGNFGYQPHRSYGQSFIRRAEFLASRAHIPLVWIDGNRDNHRALRALGPRGDGFVEIAPHVLYAPRGHRWTWATVRFGALGGAHSADWRGRIEGHSWWPEETVTGEDLARLGLDELDVLVTHDAPDGTSVVDDPPTEADEPNDRSHRCRVADAVANTRPRLIVHGHRRVRYRDVLPNDFSTATDASRDEAGAIRVEGLASVAERDGTAWALLDLPTLTFTDGAHASQRRSPSRPR